MQITNMLISHVENMVSPRTGSSVANQFIIIEKGEGWNGNFIKRETFQSYKSIIAVETRWQDHTEIVLDETYWNYSVTTLKYLKQFLGTNYSKKEIEDRIKDGTYKLGNLN